MFLYLVYLRILITNKCKITACQRSLVNLCKAKNNFFAASLKGPAFTPSLLLVAGPLKKTFFAASLRHDDTLHQKTYLARVGHAEESGGLVLDLKVLVIELSAAI